MQNSKVVVGNYVYSGTDAQRTLLHLNDIWQHHLSGGGLDASRCAAVERQLVQAAHQLAGTEANLSLKDVSLNELGEWLGKRVDELDRTALTNFLGELWEVLATLHTHTSTHHGVVSGLHASGGGVPKLPIDSATVGWSGVEGDRQGSRVHHGRPWQALCLWSDDVIANFAAQGHPIRPGCAGENITVRGLPWEVARPGAKLTIGSVEATVTAYAIPCSQNEAWFTGGDFELMSHERGPVSRIYARVDRPGTITLGDSLTLRL
jgi:MOSC domain-containing protein YiiM